MEFISDVATAFQEHLVTTLVVGAFGVVSWILNKLVGVFKEHLKLKREIIENEMAEQVLLKQGMLALLRFRINKICACIREKGYLEVDDKQDLDDMYNAYSALGGNGRTKILYQETSKLPIK